MYVDGFVIPVPADGRDAFIAHARRVDAKLIAFGATRIVETLGHDVPHGQATDFYRAVAAGEGETVAFAWIEWPDKATRDAAFARLRADPMMDEGKPPFDGRRMIFGGFETVVEMDRGSSHSGGGGA